MANVNPWVFILKLVGAIICLIFTPLWLIQMYLLSYLVFCVSLFLSKVSSLTSFGLYGRTKCFFYLSRFHSAINSLYDSSDSQGDILRKSIDSFHQNTPNGRGKDMAKLIYVSNKHCCARINFIIALNDHNISIILKRWGYRVNDGFFVGGHAICGCFY